MKKLAWVRSKIATSELCSDALCDWTTTIYMHIYIYIYTYIYKYTKQVWMKRHDMYATQKICISIMPDYSWWIQQHETHLRTLVKYQESNIYIYNIYIYGYFLKMCQFILLHIQIQILYIYCGKWSNQLMQIEYLKEVYSQES